jgi:hypothetical protein
MTREEFKEVIEYARKREEKVYAWLRYLIGLASGALAVLVSLQSHVDAGTAGVAQKVALVALGCGILLGSLRLYGEVWTARELVKRLVEERKRQAEEGDPEPSPISVALPRFVKQSEWLCYTSFVVSVVSLIVYAVTRN